MCAIIFCGIVSGIVYSDETTDHVGSVKIFLSGSTLILLRYTKGIYNYTIICDCYHAIIYYNNI